MQTETIVIDRSARNLAVGFDQPITRNGGLATLRRGYDEARRMGQNARVFVGGRPVTGMTVNDVISRLANDPGMGVEVSVVSQ